MTVADGFVFWVGAILAQFFVGLALFVAIVVLISWLDSR